MTRGFLDRPVRGLRHALLASLAAAAVVAIVDPADARTHGKHKLTGANSPALGEPLWSTTPRGAVILVVSIADQRLTIYDDGVPVARSPVSTGVAGHLTPRGVFTVIQKDRFHRSNIYSNAPMPFMERVTWSGVALHEGHVTGHPASHGCVRLPHDVAAKLWTYLKLGARVVIANTDVAPREFSHPKLFAALKPGQSAAWAPAAALPGRLAQMDTGSASDASPAAPVAAPAVPAPEPVAEPVIAAAPAIDPAPDANPTQSAEAPAGPAPVTEAPAVPTQAAEAPKADAPTPAPAAPAVPVSVAAPLIPPGAGHVSIFISKKEGKLFVRRGFLPVYETPATISDPQKPLGSHLFTAMAVEDNGATVRWSLVDLADQQPSPPAPRLRKGEAPPPPAASPEPSSAAEALDRVSISDEARVAIGELLSPGTSLIVSDQGLGRETTAKGSDFIVLTR